MAEKSKFIGDLGEELADKFLKRLGWSVSGAWNQDIDCNHPDHTTSKEKSDKKIHGIDAVFSYTNPYTNNDDILIVEAKALAWMAKEKQKTENALGKQLDEFVTAIVEKSICAVRSAKFKEIYGHKEKIGQTKVILCYYAHDYFSNQIWSKITRKIVLATAGSKIPIFLVNNDVMERGLTAVSFLEKKVAELNASNKEYFFPELARQSSSNFWQSYIPIEYLFSSFYLCRIKHPKGENNYIIYQGSYSQDAFKRFYAALGRLQILSLDNLILVPLGLDKVEQQRHGLEVAVNNKNIEVEGRKVSLTVETPDKVVPSFAWNRG